MAITASELRIGNYIYNDNVVVKIDARSIFNIWDKSNKYSPIPIAEEWLLKFGFEKINSTWYGFGNFRICISFDVEWGNNWMGIRLKYIHQLQNLYFALTGKELTYGNNPN